MSVADVRSAGGIVLVDTNVLLDIFTPDPKWFAWSARELGRAADEGRVAVNPIIYAEVSMRFERIEDLDAALPASAIERLDLPWEAAFLAGKCFLRYKRQGGVRTAPLPDFYIGAHAAVSGLSLLTRDARRYRTYFPTLSIIAPD